MEARPATCAACSEGLDSSERRNTFRGPMARVKQSGPNLYPARELQREFLCRFVTDFVWVAFSMPSALVSGRRATCNR